MEKANIEVPFKVLKGALNSGYVGICQCNMSGDAKEGAKLEIK